MCIVQLGLNSGPVLLCTEYIFGQGVNAQKFLAYNFPTLEENLTAYGREEPPEYKLEKVTYPVHVFFFKSSSILIRPLFSGDLSCSPLLR